MTKYCFKWCLECFQICRDDICFIEECCEFCYEECLCCLWCRLSCCEQYRCCKKKQNYDSPRSDRKSLLRQVMEDGSDYEADYESDYGSSSSSDE